MKVLFALVILTILPGCVTYTQHFAPGRGAVLCANLATCKELP